MLGPANGVIAITFSCRGYVQKEQPSCSCVAHFTLHELIGAKQQGGVNAFILVVAVNSTYRIGLSPALRIPRYIPC